MSVDKDSKESTEVLLMSAVDWQITACGSLAAVIHADWEGLGVTLCYKWQFAWMLSLAKGRRQNQQVWMQKILRKKMFNM